ncbi:MAG: tetratricopeptide repeat protein [Trichodesmium sp. St5_bin8]|nr:tetratricopeptide repeat protein [Trichodesmium sp. St5_bin8]
MNNQLAEIASQEGDIKLQKNYLKDGCQNDPDAIKEMFQQFIPKDEEIVDAQYLGVQGFFGVGNRQFACVTKRRIASLSVGFFGEINYQDGYLEHIHSCFAHKPNYLALYLFIAVNTANIVIDSESRSLEELIVTIVFGLIVVLILLPFIGKQYYQVFKSGLLLTVREGRLSSFPFFNNDIVWYSSNILYISAPRKLLTKTNSLYREFIISREERLNIVEKYPLPDFVSRSEIPELTPLPLSSLPSVDAANNNITPKIITGLIAAVGIGGFFAITNILIPQLKEKKAKNLLEEANSLEEIGNYESALEKYREVFELLPESADAPRRACLILNLVENSEPETTISVCKAAISFNPYNHFLWKEKGDALWKLDQKEEALESYQKVVEIQSDDSEVWYKIGLIWENKGEINEALNAFNKAIKGNGEFGEFSIADVWQKKCYLLAEQGEDTQETYYACNQRVELVDYDYQAWKERGNALSKLEGKRQALRSYQKAVEIKSDDSEVWYEIGLIYQEMYQDRKRRSDALDALNAFDKAIEDNGKSGEFSIDDVWDKKCSIYLDLERFPDAFAACKKINRKLTNATVTGTSWQTRNVRSGSTTEAEVLFELPGKAPVRFIKKEYNWDEERWWYKIYSPQYQRQGWIAGDLIRLDERSRN